MRFPVPGEPLRRRVRALLLSFFDEGDEDELDEAMRLIAGFYRVTPPAIGWRRQIDRGATAGRTHADGRFELIWPRFWHLQTVVPATPEAWAETVMHEWWHLLTWVDEERKADAFAQRWMEGA